MARRSSARLAGRYSSTPKRVSLSHDVPTRTPRTAPNKLGSLHEDDEMPGSFPQSRSPTPTRPTKRVALGVESTPKNVTPIQPADHELHPQLHHQTTAKPMEEARYLGFTNMAPHTDPPKQSSRIATLQATPTKAQNPAEDVKSPTFQFTFRREHSLELSPEAKRLMLEKREEAMRIREQMVASEQKASEAAQAAMRKIATPKGKKGRFSEVHSAQFQKMDSIAGHASAFRVKQQDASTPQKQVFGEKKEIASAVKSLKRSPSKAQLDDNDSSSKPRTLQRSPSKPAFGQPGSSLPRAMSTNTLGSRTDADSSPAKRIKRSEGEDVSATRLPSSDDEKPLPTTPQQTKTLRLHPGNPHLSNIATPTQASLARAASIKSVKTSKIPAPSLARSPSKPSLIDAKQDADGPATPLLARTPAKAAIFSTTKPDQPNNLMSPLLARSPTKGSTFKQTTEHTASTDSPPAVPRAPLLARSPLKMSTSNQSTDQADKETIASSSIPLLARSPAKIALQALTAANSGEVQTPGKPFGSGLMGRFNLLRSSPMKSILRTPQRLYSDDPAKIAAGTHLATPPKQRQNVRAAPMTAPVQKHVDFTSSTKAREEVKMSASPSSKSPTPQPIASADVNMKDEEQLEQVAYPKLDTDSFATARLASPSPQKRRQTATPGDFTFRAGMHDIVFFGDSPNAPPASAGSKRPSTIRHISSDNTSTVSLAVAQGSKKRKFEFENDAAVLPLAGEDNKENAAKLTSATAVGADAGMSEEDSRPAKRAKTAPASPHAAGIEKKKQVVSPAKRLPTLGVKPKGASKEVDAKKKRGSTMISRERLNALAQPKKRG